MVDVLTPEERSRNMAAIRGKNTAPEIRVRSFLHAMGYRFRLHRRDLPGKPDIVLPKFNTVIFVNGCYWHCHDCKNGKVKPTTHAEFWAAKRAGNVKRDEEVRLKLKNLGWRVLTIWECETKCPGKLSELLKKLDPESEN